MSEKVKQDQVLKLVKPFPALEWALQGDPTPDWLIKDFLPADTLALVSGPRKLAYKTWFILLVSTLLATGKSYGSLHAPKPGRVLFIEEEGPAVAMRSRIRKVLTMVGCETQCGAKTMPTTEAHQLFNQNVAFMHWPRVKLDDPDWITELCIFTSAWKPKLIVLDALTYMSRGDENKKQDMQVVIDALARLRKLGACVMFVYHTGQTEKSNVDLDVRGSTVLVDAYDVHFALRRTLESDTEVKFYAKYRDFAPKKMSFSWYFTEDTENMEGMITRDGSVKLEIGELKKPDTVSSVIDRLKAQMQPGMEYNLQDFRQIVGLPAAEAARTRAQLIKDGVLRPVKGGRMIVLKP